MQQMFSLAQTTFNLRQKLTCSKTIYNKNLLKSIKIKLDNFCQS